MRRRLVTLLATLVTGSAVAAPGSALPPEQPTAGYGSTEHYVAAIAKTYRWGDPSTGNEVRAFVPDVLKNGADAPVVVYLHSFGLTDPTVYRAHVEHILAQGYVVVIPQFQRAGLSNLFRDTDQRVFLERAIRSTERVLRRLGPVVDRSELYLYGHSVGGLLAYAWPSAGGPRIQGMVLANPAFSPPRIPFVNIRTINWRIAALAVIGKPVILLGGEDDDIAPTSALEQAFDALVFTSHKSVYEAPTDGYGRGTLTADHLAPLTGTGRLPGFLYRLIGDVPDQDALDWGYTWAALDALLAGEAEPTFDLGDWSDGTPVAPVDRLR